MDMCLVLAELDPAAVEAGFERAQEYLGRYSFTENRDSSEKQIMEYQRSTARSEKNWHRFLESGLNEELAALLERPYQWRRLEGEIEIEDNRHVIQLFQYPVSKTKAGVSIFFDASMYDAIYMSRSLEQNLINQNVKEDFISFLILMAMSFSADAFALKSFRGIEDLVLSLSLKDVQYWLTEPSEGSIRRWVFLLVGIRDGIIDRQVVEQMWVAEQVKQSSAGYLIYDGIV